MPVYYRVGSTLSEVIFPTPSSGELFYATLCGHQNEHENEIFDDVSDDPFDQNENKQNREQTHPEPAVVVCCR